MEIILIQNSYIFNLFILKTRRYRSLIKLKFVPFLISLTYQKVLISLLKSISINNLPFINELQKYYLETNIWFSYKYNIGNNLGLISNNIHRSYNFWMIKNIYNFFFFNKIIPVGKRSIPFRSYVKHIRLIQFSITKYALKQSFIFTLKILLKLYTSYNNRGYSICSFILINHLYDFFLFYNFYYFKVHNY